MAAITESFDVKIRVIFPFLTKSLPEDDNDRINATGNFNFEPPPQVDTAQGSVITNSPQAETSKTERIQNLKDGLSGLMDDFDRIQDSMRKKAKHITLRYDPEITQNESLANAEEALFGSASGAITYEMFEEVLAYNEQINKYISHMSIENGGTVESVA